MSYRDDHDTVVVIEAPDSKVLVDFLNTFEHVGATISASLEAGLLEVTVRSGDDGVIVAQCHADLAEPDDSEE